MRRRRDLAVLAASLLAHLGLVAAWFAARPPDVVAEPPVMRIALIRPPPREAPRPRTPPPAPPPSERPIRLHVPPAPAAPETAGPPPPPAWTSKPVDPRRMTDQELLAGPKPDLGKIFADEQRQPITRNGVLTGCKPVGEHSDRILPPCPVWGALTHNPPAQLPNRPDVAAEAAYRNAVRRYRDAPGDAGYPGLRCAILHSCKP